MSRLPKLVLAFVLLGVVLPGCPKPTPTPAPPPDGSIPNCQGVVVAKPEDVCPGTTSGYPYYQCVRCQGGEGCVAASLQVYCIAGSGGCLGDPLCSSEAAPRHKN